MARNALGSLIVRLGLDTAEFTAGLTRGEFAAKKFRDSVNRTFNGISDQAIAGFAKGLASAFAIGVIVDWGKAVVNAADNLRDLSLETGSSVEALSRLQNIALIGGGSVDEFQSAIQRLSAGLNGSEELSTKTAHALQFLGISAKDPAEAMQQLADKFEGFSDGASKAALARDLFGRAGVRFIATLHDIATAQDINATVTDRQAREAEQLAEAIRKVTNQSNDLKNTLLSDVVPALSRVLEQFVEGKKIAGGFAEALRLFSSLSIGATPAESIKSLNDEIDRLNASKNNLTAIGRALDGALGSQSTDKLIADAKKKLAFAQLLQRQGIDTNDPRNLDARDLKARQRPDSGYVSPAGGQKGAKDQTANLLLAGQLRDLERSIKDEEDTLRDRERFLDEYYRDNQLSTEDYYSTRQQVIADALSNEISLYNQEEAALRKFIASPKTDSEDRLRAEEKVREVIDKRSKAEKDAAIASIGLSIDQTRAVKQYGLAVEAVALQIKELQGDTVGAGIGRLLQQQRTDRERATAEGDTALTAQLDKIVALTRAQLQLNEATNSYSRVQLSINNAQQRIDLLQQTGAITELDAINKRAQLSRDRIGQLRAEADEVERLALAMEKSTFRDDQLLRVEQMRIAIDQLAAQADVLNRKFNDIGANAFADALSSVVTGAKSAKDAIKDFEKSVVASITNIASKNIGEYLFGKDGPLGGFGRLLGGAFGGKGGDGSEGAVTEGAGGLSGFLRDMFGGGSKNGAAAGVAASSLTAAGSVLTTAGTLLTTAAATLEAAAASMVASSVASSASGIANGLGGFFSSGGSGGLAGWTSGFDIGGFASGGMPPVGKASLVGEHGPELFVPRVAGTIVPNHKMGRAGMMGGGMNITINVPPGTSRQSAEQVALHAGRQLSHVLRRRN